MSYYISLDITRETPFRLIRKVQINTSIGTINAKVQLTSISTISANTRVESKQEEIFRKFHLFRLGRKTANWKPYPHVRFWSEVGYESGSIEVDGGERSDIVNLVPFFSSFPLGANISFSF